jgi:glycosyltransferase involved in cell wall biosynthesis
MPETERSELALAPLRNPATVTVIMAVRNEARYLGAALDSLVSQTYPRELLDVVIADAESSDATRDIAAARRDRLLIMIVSNSRRNYPAGLNAAIAEARGDVLVKLDGHAELDPEYIAATLDGLATGEAVVVGARVRTRGRGPFGRAAAVALSHPLVVGGAAFRYAGARALVKSVPFGAYRREVFERIGRFREVGRAEDLEFHARIQRNGGRLLLLEQTLATYWCRETPLGLAQQYFASGRDVATHSVGSWYQNAPALALAVFLASLAFAIFGFVPWTLPGSELVLYALLLAAVGVRSKSLGVSVSLTAAAVVIVHAAQAAGWWAGTLRLR